MQNDNGFFICDDLNILCCCGGYAFFFAAFVSLPQKCSAKSKLKISAKMAVIMSNTVSPVSCVEFLNANPLIK